ncbi:MAG: YicC family protein [Candidatus Omnitrophica bacterium]|nr:YicC family protein [Candidatus Omnitrophota bacterium]
MIKSMTGYGGATVDAGVLGKVSVEMRSTNHKSLDISIRLPEGFMFLEDKIKKLIEARACRGRVICFVNVSPSQERSLCVNEGLLANYLKAVKKIKNKYGLKQDISLDTAINLPGVLSFSDIQQSKDQVSRFIFPCAKKAVDALCVSRNKEGKALENYLSACLAAIYKHLEKVIAEFKAALEKKLSSLNTDEERAGFRNNADISEELHRLEYHLGTLRKKLNSAGCVGKEMDFIAQEMQREANTTGAKTFEAAISSKVVHIKSEIEKIREQIQNIE